MLHTWLTHLPPEAGFLAAWESVIHTARGAHFAFRTDYLGWEGEHARPMWAVLADEGERRGALILRPERGGWACGLPWRCAAVMAHGAHENGPLDLRRENAVWMFEQARRLVGSARLRMYLPFEPPPGVPGFLAGVSVHQNIHVTDGELRSAMASSKRRMIRRATDRGYEIRDADGLNEMRMFYEVSQAAKRRRGEKLPFDEHTIPEPGMRWREWELPWMWLLLAVREGKVESGAVDSIGPGWSLETRTAASTPEARHDGAFALLCHEEAKHARDAGMRWLNHGGDTVFKREMAGSLGHRVPMWCWLAGGAMWRLPNEAVAAMARIRRHIAERRRAGLLRAGGTDTTE